MLSLHCNYCHGYIMPINEKVPRYLSLDCPHCYKKLDSNQVYLKTINIENPKLERKNDR